MSATLQPRLLTVPMAGLLPIAIGEANQLLVAWGHRLGPVHRPFRQEAFALELDGRPISVATSGSIISDRVAGYQRDEVVELTRLCSDPDHAWATRVLLRLWREVCAPRWPCWPVRAAISYSHNLHHRGDLYRFDGWERVRTDAGSRGSEATWGRHGYQVANAASLIGPKTIWVWRYAAGIRPR